MTGGAFLRPRAASLAASLLREEARTWSSLRNVDDLVRNGFLELAMLVVDLEKAGGSVAHLPECKSMEGAVEGVFCVMRLNARSVAWVADRVTGEPRGFCVGARTIMPMPAFPTVEAARDYLLQPANMYPMSGGPA